MTTQSPDKAILSSPILETAVEILFILGASWVPILYGAWTSGAPISGYLDKGEITLLVIGFCGSIFFILSLKAHPINPWLRALITFILVFVIFFPSASALGKNPQFKTQLSSGEFKYLVFIYILTIFMYFYCAVRSKSVDLPSPEVTALAEQERTNSILREASKRGRR